MNRRKVLTMIVAGGTYSLPFPSISTPARTAASQRIVIRHWGGSFAKIFREILYRPFTQATGIEVVGVESRAEPIAEIQMMVKTSRHLWDMAAISDRATLLLTTDKIYLERHELEHDPNILSIPSQFRSPYGVGANIYTTLLAYRTHAFKRGAPTSWLDLWNIDQLPGRRALRKRPFDTIEIALMADGVPPGGVYPCDLERAFRSLDRIKRHVDVWWTDGPQLEQLLISGEVDMVPALNLRAQSAITAGVPLGISWEQHVYENMHWAILKGTPHADACRRFIQFASDPKRQALLAPYGIAPTQPDAFKYIDSKHAKLLPTYPENLKKGLLTDAAYWVKHQQAATERFNHWLVS